MSIAATPIPTVDTPVTLAADQVPAMKMSQIWFEFLQSLAAPVVPTISSTVGDQRIDARCGSFLVAPAAVLVTILNTQINTNSIVLAQVMTNDATARIIAVEVSPTKVAVAAREFLVHLVAPTGQIRIGFYIVAP